MRFSIRELFWATGLVALVTAWLITSRQQASFIHSLKQRIQALEAQSAEHERLTSQQRLIAEQSAQLAAQKHRSQHQEILELRQLLKQSIKDQRDWFELEVAQNRIIAIAPATTDSGEVTARTVQLVENTTGLDGQRLLHFLTPIRQLRPRATSP